jgi:aspartyl/glutamyl-tRNA(Asn/Gln) amidotransferase C subunit
MKISDQAIQHIARLARLRLDETEVSSIRNDLNRILDYVDQLKSLPLAEVEPTNHVIDLAMTGRPDQPEPSLSADEATANAPRVVQQMFLVPRILEEGREEE